MNTYQFVWARDTHTFSCHHNTEPTTSTTRADSSSDSSTGPLKARQRCSLEEAAAGEAGTEEGRALAPAPGMGLGGGERTEQGERGGEKKETKQTNPPRRRGRDAARGGGEPEASRGVLLDRPLHPARARSPPAPGILQPLPPRPAHAAPASVQKPKAGLGPAAGCRGVTPDPAMRPGDPQAETPRRRCRTSPELALPRVPTAPPALR